MTLGRTIKIVRMVEGKSQQDIAEALGVSVWRISRLERGIQSPRPSEAAELQVVLPRLREAGLMERAVPEHDDS